MDPVVIPTLDQFWSAYLHTLIGWAHWATSSAIGRPLLIVVLVCVIGSLASIFGKAEPLTVKGD